MTPAQLEELLEGASEAHKLEFKGPMHWSVKSLIKDLLALSNVQNGGKIVFGIEDETLRRVGLSAEQAASFVPDQMKDQVAKYADPYIQFEVHEVPDANGLLFIVIDVFQFDEMPVICKVDTEDVNAGTLYYRSKSKKPQSARVSNAHDMREIIDVAAFKRMQQLRGIGFVAPANRNDDIEDLGGL